MSFKIRKRAIFPQPLSYLIIFKRHIRVIHRKLHLLRPIDFYLYMTLSTHCLDFNMLFFFGEIIFGEIIRYTNCIFYNITKFLFRFLYRERSVWRQEYRWASLSLQTVCSAIYQELQASAAFIRFLPRLGCDIDINYNVLESIYIDDSIYLYSIPNVWKNYDLQIDNIRFPRHFVRYVLEVDFGFWILLCNV